MIFYAGLGFLLVNIFLILNKKKLSEVFECPVPECEKSYKTVLSLRNHLKSAVCIPTEIKKNHRWDTKGFLIIGGALQRGDWENFAFFLGRGDQGGLGVIWHQN